MSTSDLNDAFDPANYEAGSVSGPATVPLQPAEAARYQAIGQAAESFVSQRGPQLGSALSTWIRNSQDFDPKSAGFVNFSAFISAYAPHLERISRVGADVLWGFREQAHTAAAQEPLPHRLWRAIASPNSVRVVYVFVHTATGEWRIEKAPSTGPVDAAHNTENLGEWKRILPLSAESHRAVAKQFLERTDVEPVREALRPTLEQRVWWTPWLQVINEHTALAEAWYATREGAIRQHIRTSLVAVGLPESLLNETAAYPAPGPTHQVANNAAGGSANTNRDAERSIRELVLAVLAHMDEGQLRELRLPAGAVMDALRRS
jgi:hypothetical protein